MSRITSLTSETYASPINWLFKTIRDDEPEAFLDTIKPIADDEQNEIPDVMGEAEETLMEAQNLKGIGGELTHDPLPLNNLVAILKYCEEPEEDSKPAFYEVLNRRCRAKNREVIKPFVKYMWLLIKSLEFLRPFDDSALVHRGVRKDLQKDYPEKKRFFWDGFTSTTKSLDYVRDFLGSSGGRTMFEIELTQKQARDISLYSPMDEGEVLLPPGSRFEVMSVMRQNEDLVIIHLRELKSSQWIIDLHPRVSLTPTQIADMFSKFDLNRNGQISRDEFTQTFSQLGIQDQEAIDRFFDSVHTDENGDVNYAAFVTWLDSGSALSESVLNLLKVSPTEEGPASPTEESGSRELINPTQSVQEDDQPIDGQTFFAGDWVRVKTQTKSDSKGDVDLYQDLVGRISRIDDRGNASVEFSGLTRREWILKKNFGKLDKVDRPPVPQTLHVSGADGSHGNIVNGVYSLADEEYNNHPAWNKQSDTDKWLLRSPENGIWYVSNSKRKEEDRAGGWLRGSSGAHADPRDVAEWKVWLFGDSWEVQSISVTEPTALYVGSFFRIKQLTTSDCKGSVDLCKGWVGHVCLLDRDGDAQVEFDNLDERIWISKSKFFNLDVILPPCVVQCLHISGATGSNSIRVNGVWKLADQEYHNHPMWRKVGSSDTWLLRFPSDGMWYVTDNDHKNTGKPGGWLSSSSNHHAVALSVPEWKVWDRDSWEVQRIQVIEAKDFSTGDFFRMKHPMNSDNRNGVYLSVGLIGHVWDIDKEGDAHVEFESVSTMQWICKKHFCNMERVTAPHVPKTINISGATGSCGGLANGVFNLTSERFNKHPLWVKSDDSEKWLLRFSNGMWFVTSTEIKNTNKAGGWLQSSSAHNVDVTKCSEWKVWNGESWEEQSINVS